MYFSAYILSPRNNAEPNYDSQPEPVFVNFLWSLGIDSQPGGTFCRIEACPEFKKIGVTQYVCFLSQAFSEKSLVFSKKDRIFLKSTKP
jgi:hypothetical protein